jgi:hypothetical protein
MPFEAVCPPSEFWIARLFGELTVMRKDYTPTWDNKIRTEWYVIGDEQFLEELDDKYVVLIRKLDLEQMSKEVSLV